MADDSHKFPVVHRQGDPVQGPHLVFPRVIDFVDVLYLDEMGHMRTVLFSCSRDIFPAEH